MNRNIGTDPNRMLGATISANNATYGLAPARPAGPHETVTEVVNAYNLTVRTAEGNVHLGGTYTIYQYAEAVTHAPHLQQRTALQGQAGGMCRRTHGRHRGPGGEGDAGGGECCTDAHDL